MAHWRPQATAADKESQLGAELEGVDAQIRPLVNRQQELGLLASPPMQEALTKVSTSITERQRQVIELIAAGCSNEEVGERLGISPRTAKAHCDVLRQKLGVARRRQIPVAFRSLTGEDPLAQRPDLHGAAPGR